jgi:hypothetical protein
MHPIEVKRRIKTGIQFPLPLLPELANSDAPMIPTNAPTAAPRQRLMIKAMTIVMRHKSEAI